MGSDIKLCEADLDGTIHILGDADGTIAVSGNMAGGGNLLSNGVIQIDGNLGGTVHVYFDALGEILVGEDAEGDIQIGGNITSTGKVLVKGDISGDLTVDGCVDGGILANSDGVGQGEITGDVSIEGEFNGNICGDNLAPMETLPENISIEDFGANGTICGARPGCGDGTISSSDPSDGTEDARQPHPQSDCSPGARQGIGSEDEPIIITLSEGGANNLDCWALCETGIEEVDTGAGCGTLDANAIKTLTETSTGVYEIVLDRPISAGHWTTVTYRGDDTYVSYASLPADANADETSSSVDILDHIDCCLNHTCTPPFGNYSCDIDHSGAVNSSDLLTLIDLLNGSGKFIVWNGESLPANSCPGDNFRSGGGEAQSSEGDNQQLADWFVNYLTTADPQGGAGIDEFHAIVESVTQWCVDHFNGDERTALADRLSDPTLKFASDAGAKAASMVVEVITP